MHHDPADEAALEWLTIDELAARRRGLVRELDRLTRRGEVDELEHARILRDAATIDAVQRGRARR